MNGRGDRPVSLDSGNSDTPALAIRQPQLNSALVYLFTFFVELITSRVAPLPQAHGGGSREADLKIFQRAASPVLAA